MLNNKWKARNVPDVHFTCIVRPVMRRIGWQVSNFVRPGLTEDWASILSQVDLLLGNVAVSEREFEEIVQQA